MLKSCGLQCLTKNNLGWRRQDLASTGGTAAPAWIGAWEHPAPGYLW